MMTILSQTPIKYHHRPAIKPLVGKHGSVLGFIKFILWVGIIGLLLSLVACEQVQPKTIANNDNSDGLISFSKIVNSYANHHSKKLLGTMSHG